MTTPLLNHQYILKPSHLKLSTLHQVIYQAVTFLSACSGDSLYSRKIWLQTQNRFQRNLSDRRHSISEYRDTKNFYQHCELHFILWTTGNKSLTYSLSSRTKTTKQKEQPVRHTQPDESEANNACVFECICVRMSFPCTVWLFCLHRNTIWEHSTSL